MKLKKSWAAAAAVLALSGAALAALVARGGGMIYDTMPPLTGRTSWFTADSATGACPR